MKCKRFIFGFLSALLMCATTSQTWATPQETIPDIGGGTSTTTNEEEELPVNVSAIIGFDSEGEIYGGFSGGETPAFDLEIVHIVEPTHGDLKHHAETEALVFLPSAEEYEGLDEFTVYAANEARTSWNITKIWYDKESNEMMFRTDIGTDIGTVNTIDEDGFCNCSLPRACLIRGSGWTRFWGGVKLIGGALETTAGVAIGVGTSWTGVGAVAGGAVAVHGADTTQAGFRQLWYGEEVRTFTSIGISATASAAGLDDETSILVGEVVDAGAGLASGAGASKVPQLLDKLGDSAVLVGKIRAPLAVPGVGYIDDTIELTGDFVPVIKNGVIANAAGNGVRGLDDLDQLHMSAMDDMPIPPKRVGSRSGSMPTLPGNAELGNLMR